MRSPSEVQANRWRPQMQVKDAMTQDVEMASPSQTLRHAGLLLPKVDAGALQAADKHDLLGMHSCRGTAVRPVARGKRPKAPVREVVSDEVNFGFADADLDHVPRPMPEIKVRRL